MVTATVRVCGPFDAVVVSHVYQRVVPVIVWLVNAVPSTESVNVFDCPHVAVVDIPTDCAPLTEAPAAGYVNDAVKLVGGGVLALETVTVREAVAVAPAESVTVTPSV